MKRSVKWNLKKVMALLMIASLLFGGTAIDYQNNDIMVCGEICEEPPLLF